MQNSIIQYYLSSLGNAILQSIWQAGILWLIFLGITFFIKNSKIIYFTAASFQVLSFFIFGYTIFFGSTISLFSSLSFSGNWVAFILPIVSILYIIIGLFFLLKFVNSFLGFKKKFVFETIGNNEVFNHLQKLKKQYFKKEVKIQFCKNIISPLTYGFIKPVILFPIASVNLLTIDQLEYLLLHEIAHIKRYDYIQNFVLKLIEQVLFFNPFTHLFQREIEQAREYCCDEWVMKEKPQALEYAKSLLAIATIEQKKLTFALPALGRKNGLKNRIYKILKQPVHSHLTTRAFVFFLLLVGAGFLFSSIQNKSQSVNNKLIVLVNYSKQKDASIYEVQKPTLKVKETFVNPNKKTNKQAFVKTNVYNEKDIKTLKEGLLFLSDLAKENSFVNKILVANPSIQAVENVGEKPTEIINAVNNQSTQTVRRFFIPQTSTKVAVFITITVDTKNNNKKVVTIELDEQKRIEKS